ncbi:MAG: NADH:flavin oxidoreductase [Pseudomonadota bacterium]|nr:NADH:flavin oxidoreductase [Pseudomonadota bacterium]
MWKPPERIKFEPDPGPAPDENTADAAALFTPLDLGPVQLRTRSWVPAMVPWRASPDGLVTDGVLDWYERFARGRPGGLVIEATGIRDVPSGPLLRIGHDRFIPGLAELAKRVHEASHGLTRLFIQLIDFLAIRRRPERNRYLNEFLAITDAHRAALDLGDAPEKAVRANLAGLDDDSLLRILSPRELEALQMGYRERVTDTHLAHIADLPNQLPGLFADAARRAEAAGIDGAELHYTHAYTMASFLSATNDRNDGYGGPKENRVRLPLAVFDAVRSATGAGFAVGARLSAEECIDGGSGLVDSCYFAQEFARAGMDFLSLSRGGKFDDAKQPAVGEAAYPYTGRSGYECMPAVISDSFGPFGRNLEAAGKVRAAIRAAGFETPVIVTGGIHGFRQAEGILARGEGDAVGAARQSLADPDWYEKIRQGRGAEVRLCTYSNYCEGLDQKHKQVTCRLWDREGLDSGVALTSDGKRRTTAPDWQ